MRFSSSISEAQSVPDLVAELTESAGTQLGGRADLALLFVTADLRDLAPALASDIREVLQSGTVLGVTCEGVLGGSREVERRPGAALLAASLPGVELHPFHVGLREWETLLSSDELLQQRVGAENRAQILFGDPFTTPIDEVFTGFDQYLHAPTFGGMASGAHSPGGNRLIWNDMVYDSGAIGVGLSGSVTVDAVVSQGCRPIGSPMIVTRVEDALIMELGRRPAYEVAHEVLNTLPESDRALLRNGVFLGVVINEYRDTFGRGDFLVRGVMGGNPDTGALAVGDMVRAGQTVQFHVRDAHTAHEDLREMLAPQGEQGGAAGALLISCNGRGTRMFEEPHHDISTTRSILPGLPVGGFFAMGEFGPVGGKSFIHGHTASLAVFRPGQ